MAPIHDVIEGLKILSHTAFVPLGLTNKGETDRTRAHVEAYIGIIRGPRATPAKDEIEQLEELGWHFDEDHECWSRYCWIRN